MWTTDTVSSGQDVTEEWRDTDDRGENILVLAKKLESEIDSYCVGRLSSSHDTGGPNALFVSLDEPPDQRLKEVFRHLTDRPANVGIVCCDQTRGTAATQPTNNPEVGPSPWIATVSSPAALTEFGDRIQQVLSTWENDVRPIELCVHPLTTLLQAVDDSVAFRFCRLITSIVTATGARSHFHLDPGDVDDQTMATFRRLFDRVVDRP